MYKLFLKYLHKFKIYFMFLLLLIIFSTILALYIPVLTSNYVDFIIYNFDEKIIYQFVWIFISLSFINLFIGFIISRLKLKIQSQMSFKYIEDTLSILDNKKLLEVEKKNTSYLAQRITEDCSKVIIFFIDTLSGIISNGSIIIFCTFILIAINSQIVLIAISLEMIFIVWYKFMAKKLYLSKKNVIEKNNELFSSLYERISLLRFSRIYVAQKILQNKLLQKFNEYLKFLMKNQVIVFIFNSIETIIEVLGQAFIYVICGFCIMNKHMTIGTFIIISNYFTRLISSVCFFVSVSDRFVESKVSYDRINQIYSIQDEVFGSKKINNINKIEIKNLSFSYDGINMIFNNFSKTFIKGKVYCIKGQNGIGKSTLLDLLVGLYGGSEAIYFNEVSISNLDINYFRKNNITYISQKNMFMVDTVINNISLENSYAFKYIEDLLNKFQLTSKYRSVELNDVINEKMNNFSGGELQKISLIRGFLNKKDILLFDEPTSFLDYKSRVELIKLINNIKNECIIIIVSHDSDFDKISDEIIEL